MAILKHIASKNTNYGSAIDYLKYQHDEFHLVPILDESGNMLLREEFYLDGLNCHPETFDLQKDAQYDTYHYFKDYHRELQTVCANVDNILGTEREARREQQQSRKNEHSL